MDINDIPIVCYLNIACTDEFIKEQKQEFIKNGFKNIHYHTFKSSYRNGEYSCLESHIDAYKYCLKKKHKFALIFEDNFIINTHNITKCLSLARNCMLENPDWYMIKLQQIDNKYNTIGIHNCELIDVVNGTRCFFISKNAMKDMVNINTTNTDIEQYFTLDNIKKTKSCFVITPTLINIYNPPIKNDSIMSKLFKLLKN